jgi:hypothetical protein
VAADIENLRRVDATTSTSIDQWRLVTVEELGDPLNL